MFALDPPVDGPRAPWSHWRTLRGVQEVVARSTRARALSVDPRRLGGAGVATIGALVALPLVPGHEALSCPLRTTTGVPCPLCGMTRGVGDAVRGDLGGAVVHNPGSVVLVVAVVVALLAALLTPRGGRRLVVPRWSIPALLAALWAFQLAKLVTDAPL